MNHTPADIRQYIFRTFRMANLLAYGVTSIYVPLNYIIRSMPKDLFANIALVESATLILLAFCYFLPQTKIKAEHANLLLIIAFLFSAQLIYYVFYPDNPIITMLMLYSLIPAIIIENRTQFFTYLFTVFASTTYHVFFVPTSILLESGPIDLSQMALTPRLSSIIMIMLAMVIIIYIRRVLLIRLLPQLIDTLLETEAREQRYKDANFALGNQYKKQNEVLKSTVSNLQQKERLASLGGMVAGIAHELNTPLGVSVSANSYVQSVNQRAYQALSSGNFSKQDLIDYMKSIEEATEILNTNINRAADLIVNFKALAVSQSSGIKMNFNLHDHIQSIIVSLKHEYKSQNVTIANHIPESIWLNSYPSDYGQIATNLIMNALIHAKVDNRELEIRFDGTQSHDLLHLKVTDNGKGIDQDHLEHIFEPFFTTRRDQGGSGLGLSIVYNIAANPERLNGTVHCRSEIDKGTSFEFELPIEIKTEEGFQA